jgi:hypothetical protein
MDLSAWFDAAYLVGGCIIAVVGSARFWIQRGDRLFVLGRPKHTRLIAGATGLAGVLISALFRPDVRARALGVAGFLVILVAVIGDTTWLRRVTEPRFWDRSPEPPWCAFHEKGIVFFDGRDEQFVAWREIDRYEWTGEHLTFYLAPATPGEAGPVYGWDVPFERREQVIDVIATRLQG